MGLRDQHHCGRGASPQVHHQVAASESWAFLDTPLPVCGCWRCEAGPGWPGVGNSHPWHGGHGFQEQGGHTGPCQGEAPVQLDGS